jgi:hypothetical protein
VIRLNIIILKTPSLIGAGGAPDYNAGGKFWFEFILQSLRVLKDNLNKTFNQDLFFFQETEAMVFQHIFQWFEVEKIFFDQDVEPYGMQRWGGKLIIRIYLESGESIEIVHLTFEGLKLK